MNLSLRKYANSYILNAKNTRTAIVTGGADVMPAMATTVNNAYRAILFAIVICSLSTVLGGADILLAAYRRIVLKVRLYAICLTGKSIV